MSKSIRISSLEKEGAMQASKWLQIQVLLDEKELEHFFSKLGEITLYHISGLTRLGEGEISIERFLRDYSKYITAIKSGEVIGEELFRSKLTAAMTLDIDALYALPMKDELQLLRLSKPVVQIQMHHMAFSKEEMKFRPMIFGKNSLPWGLQFSYPQLYLDPKTKDVIKLNDVTAFPNTGLFRDVRRQLRDLSLATPLLIGKEQREMNIPMRIGKQAMEWINKYPLLIKQEISVRQ